MSPCVQGQSVYISGKQGVEGPKASNARSAGNIPALRLLVGITSQTLKLKTARLLQSGSFSAARPVGRLSFATFLMGRGWLFFAEERLDVVPVYQQLAVFVEDCTVVGVGRALLGDEGVELGAEVFDLRQAREVMLVEIALRLAVLLDLVGMGIIKFARVAR